MAALSSATPLLLLLDTCGERASVALVGEQTLLAERALPERAASVALLAGVDEVLRTAGVSLHELGGLGVVSGPGSFTGVRVGLAMATGLCEAIELPLAAVSRLEVLADAAGLCEGYALLRAGRGQVFVRECVEGVTAREWLMDATEAAGLVDGRVVAYAEEPLRELAARAAEARFVEISAKDAVEAVRRCFAAGGSDPAQAEANYVRNEEDIYARRLKGASAHAG